MVALSIETSGGETAAVVSSLSMFICVCVCDYFYDCFVDNFGEISCSLVILLRIVELR